MFNFGLSWDCGWDMGAWSLRHENYLHNHLSVSPNIKERFLFVCFLHKLSDFFFFLTKTAFTQSGTLVMKYTFAEDILGGIFFALLYIVTVLLKIEERKKNGHKIKIFLPIPTQTYYHLT